jgi:tetraacyldisaccharide 4'-kinase
MKAPAFWSRPGAPLGTILSPLGCLYGCAGAVRTALARPARVAVPVICVGNLTAGGAGKTPVALAVTGALKTGTPAFLTRGYGGRMAGPVRVDPGAHGHADVGDEALLLARAAPTWVARDRAEGARAAILGGATCIVMDDGHQNPALTKDISIVVIDGETGFGNGHLLPAGPLREPISRGLARADAAVIVGTDRAGVAAQLPDALPVLTGTIRPVDVPGTWSGRRVVAFAGIGRPAKFFATLAELGCEVAATHAFADHHPFSDADVARLVADADARDAALVTTEKDAVRLPPGVREKVDVLAVRFTWDDPAAFDRFLAEKIEAAAS